MALSVDVDLFGEEVVIAGDLTPREGTDLDAFDRFIAKVDREAPGGCWVWTGAVGRATLYGRFTGSDGFIWQAHRWSYTALVGEIPAGLFIDHVCRNRACVNPAHLEPVTPRENARRRNFSKPLSRSVCHACGQHIERAA